MWVIYDICLFSFFSFSEYIKWAFCFSENDFSNNLLLFSSLDLKGLVKNEKTLECNTDSFSNGLSAEHNSTKDKLMSKCDPTETSVLVRESDDRCDHHQESLETVKKAERLWMETLLLPIFSPSIWLPPSHAFLTKPVPNPACSLLDVRSLPHHFTRYYLVCVLMMLETFLWLNESKTEVLTPCVQMSNLQPKKPISVIFDSDL